MFFFESLKLSISICISGDFLSQKAHAIDSSSLAKGEWFVSAVLLGKRGRVNCIRQEGLLG